MSFQRDLALSKIAETLVSEWLLKAPNIISVKSTTEGVEDRQKVIEIERVQGDLELVLTDRDTEYLEVKRDAVATHTGNLFLENMSDTGERTGNETIGWFDNPDATYDWFAFVVPTKGTLIMKREILKRYVDSLSNPRILAMRSNEDQPNRSTGYVVPIADIRKNCEHRWIEELK